MDRLLLSSVLFFCVLAFLQPAAASNLGGLVKNDRAYANPGESVAFDVLLWTQDENRTVYLSVADAPQGWAVIIQPGELSIGRGIGDEKVSLPSGQVMASKTMIIMKTSEVSSGENQVTVSVSSPVGTGQIAFSQSIVLRMFVELPGEKIEIENLGDREVFVTGTAAPERAGDQNITLYLVLAIVILAVSAILYRYA